MNPVRAEGAYRQALEVRADHEEALTNLVAVWLRAGRAGEASDLLSDFISKNPEVAFAYSLAARVVAQAGDRNAALELVARGIELARARQESRMEQELRSLHERLRVR